MAALVSMSNLLNGKDSRWLQLEVCREFQRNKCSRPDTECKFAHPPANVEVQNGRVTACYDSIKGRCNREKPPCKYFHPPQHLKDQLLINGRNHLALKNALMQQMGMAPPTPAPTILPQTLQPMTANRFVPASNPYNPYFGPGLMPIQIGTEHAASAMAGGSLPQAMSIASNAGTQPQKRTDRVQMDQMKFMGPYYEHFTYPGLLPYKRPAPDNKGYPMYQPSAAAYQQLMQLQSQQPYVPVSCEYTTSSSQNHALAETIYPNTSTAPNANMHHPNLYNQTSINACNMNNVLTSSHNEKSNEQLQQQQQTTQIDYNNFNNSTIFDADAQIKTPTAQQNSISQSSPSKVTPSNNIEHNMLSKNAAVVINAAAASSSSSSPDDGDSENALTVSQNAKLVTGVSGCDETAVASSTLSVETSDDTGQSVGEAAPAVDDVTQSSLQSSLDENNLNANSFNQSAISSSPAASSLAAIYTTSSITNNNNSILSRKNSLTTPNQHLINNSSKASISYSANTPSAKVDTVPDYLSASTLNNHPQAALLSAMLYNPPSYQQLALTQNLYSDSAQMAKEMAQKNYANAFKFAMAQQQQQNTVAAAKSPMNAMPYSGVALSANPSNPMLQGGPSAQRMPSSMSPVARSPYLPQLTRPMQGPFQQFVRPVNLTATNPYYAAAAAHQQFLSQQNMLYPGLTSQMQTQQLTATSGASTPTPYATNPYQYALSPAQAQAMNAQGLQASMMQMTPQMTSQPSQTGGSSAVVLNPYKKMKTS